VIAAVFPSLRLEIAGAYAHAHARAVVSDAGARTVRELSGAMLLAEVNAAAEDLGICVGTSIARARAVCAQLDVCIVHEKEVQAELERWCESALKFGASVGYALVPVPTVWIDVTGCAHLFGGEEALLKQVFAHFKGRTVYLALSEGPRLAQMVAQACARQWIELGRNTTPQRVLVTPEIVAKLPVQLLGEAPFKLFRKLGMHTFGDLQKLPKASLAHRLGASSQELLSLVLGVDRQPLSVFVPPEVPESVELDDDVHASEPILFLAKPLLEKLLLRIQGRSLGVLALELALGKSSQAQVVFPVPMTRFDDLWGVLRTHIEKLTLSAPVRSVCLRAVKLGRAIEHTETLFGGKSQKASRHFNRVFAELHAELGAARLGKLEHVDTWTLADRSRLIPFHEKTKRSSVACAKLLPVEPTLFSAQEQPASSAGELVRHLIRLERTSWWKASTLALSGDVFLSWNENRLCIVKKTERRTYTLGFVD
jgi:protein ImuB